MRKLTLYVSLAALALAGCRTPDPVGPSAVDAWVAKHERASRDEVVTLLERCAIRLEAIDDPVGAGREWFRVVFVGGERDGQVPMFGIVPKDTWLEQWTEDPLELGPGRLAWFSGPPGTYTLTAKVPCGGTATVTVVLPGKRRR